MTSSLVIFDCDGVLVDSEPISVGLIVKHCRASGFEISESEAYEAFLGKPVADVTHNAKEIFARDIPPIDLSGFQEKILEAFQNRLCAVESVDEALTRLEAPKCVASSSNMARIRMSLRLTQLGHHFDDNLFSTDMVALGKPHPDVFLYAAQQMGASPDTTIVVEDSPAGIVAAKSADMRVIGFCGASHAKPANLRDRLSVLNPDLLIDDMSQLNRAIETLLLMSA